MVRKKITKLGRPTTVGATASLTTRCSPALVKRINAWAKCHGTGASEAMRQLIEAGLEATQKDVQAGG